MNETSTDKQMTNDFDRLKIRLKTTWMAGDYDRFSRYMANDAEQLFRRLGIKPGTRLLDVGCGAGQLALIAGRAGARVTGCDIATNGLEKARARAAAEGLQIAFEEGEDPKGQSRDSSTSRFRGARMCRCSVARCYILIHPGARGFSWQLAGTWILFREVSGPVAEAYYQSARC
jgi:SAM-dependent methyltransferase